MNDGPLGGRPGWRLHRSRADDAKRQQLRADADCAFSATRRTATATASRWRCWRGCWPGCRSRFEQRRTRLLASDLIELVRTSRTTTPSASPIFRRARRRRRAISCVGCTPRFPSCRIVVGRWAPPGSGGRDDAAADRRGRDARRRDVARDEAAARRARAIRDASPRPDQRERRLMLQTRDSPRLTHCRLLQPRQIEEHRRERGVVVVAAPVRQQRGHELMDDARDRSGASRARPAWRLAMRRSFAKSLARKPGL